MQIFRLKQQEMQGILWRKRRDKKLHIKLITVSMLSRVEEGQNRNVKVEFPLSDMVLDFPLRQLPLLSMARTNVRFDTGFFKLI